MEGEVNNDSGKNEEAARTASSLLSEVKEEVKAEVKEEVTPEIIKEIQIASFSGPLPPPAILREYNDILPGAADRILKLAEEQSSHRREIENKVVSSGVVDAKLGILAGTLIALAAVGGGMWIVLRGQELVGLGAVISALVGLVYAFRYNVDRGDQDLRQKKKDLEENKE
jgi:uncharacterized membrane protein